MKKMFGVILVLMLSVSLFAGCGSNKSAKDDTPATNDTSNNADTDNADKDTDKDQDQDADKQSNEKVTLVVWEQMEPALQEAFDEVEVEFEAAYPNIDIERTHYETEELRTNFLNSSVAGGGPDIVYGPGDNVGPFITADVIIPITDVVTQDFISKIDESALDFTKVSGKYYAVPDIFGNNITLLYNKDMVDTAPQTWDELVEVASENRDADNGLYGLLYNEREPYWFIGFFNGFGGDVLDSEYNPTLNTEPMIKALQFVRDIREENGLGIEGMDYGAADSAFLEETAAMIFNGAWSWTSYIDAGVNLGVAPMPTLPNGERVTFYNATKGYSISKEVDLNDQARVEAIRAFLDFFVGDPENDAKFALANSQAPTNLESRELDIITSDPLQVAEQETLIYTKPMPIVPEMRGIWDAIRPELEAVLYEGKDPEQAAADMQETAIDNISKIRSNSYE